MTHEEAVEDCNDIAIRIGKLHARRIITQTVTFALEPDDMEKLVHQTIADFRDYLLQGGASQHDTNAAADIVYAALVREGARLSRTMTWEHGHA